MTNPEQIKMWRENAAINLAQKVQLKYGRDFRQGVDCVLAGMEAEAEAAELRGQIIAYKAQNYGHMVAKLEAKLSALMKGGA